MYAYRPQASKWCLAPGPSSPPLASGAFKYSSTNAFNLAGSASSGSTRMVLFGKSHGPVRSRLVPSVVLYRDGSHVGTCTLPPPFAPAPAAASGPPSAPSLPVIACLAAAPLSLRLFLFLGGTATLAAPLCDPACPS